MEPGSGMAGGGGEEHSAWKCAACTFDNAGALPACEICGEARGSSPTEAIAADPLPPPALAPERHAWSGGSSEVVFLRSPGEGDEDADLFAHLLEGAEPPLVWSQANGAAQREAARVAAALAKHLPVNDFLSAFCRPEHIEARRRWTQSGAGDMQIKFDSSYTSASLGSILLGLDDGVPTTPAADRPAATPAGLSREDRILAHQARLRDTVASYGLALDAMASDGNCLFRAVSRQLYGCHTHHPLVRHRVVSRLSQDRGSYAGFFESPAEFDRYLAGMAAPSTWGDELALRAVADDYGAEVHVLTSAGTGNYHLYVPMDSADCAAARAETAAASPGGGHRDGGGGPRIFLAYTFPIHYDGLVVASSAGAPAAASVAGVPAKGLAAAAYGGLLAVVPQDSALSADGIDINF